VLARLRLTEVLLPKGPIGEAPRPERLAFLRDRRFAPSVSLSTVEGDSTTASPSAVAASDWLPGTIAALYGTTDLDGIAVRDHVARHAGVHPGTVQFTDGIARSTGEPLTARPVTVEHGTARSAGPPTLDLSPVKQHWDRWFNVGRWPVEDVFYGLIERFVRRVVIDEPAATAAVHGRPTVYLGNHQTAVESLLFSILSSGLNGVNTVTIAKAEHRHTWLGLLIKLCFSYPTAVDPEVITFFDRTNKRDLVRIIHSLGDGLVDPGKSVMVHVEGTRSLSCRQPTERMSGMFIDMALRSGAPIVPVRFAGGLPVEPLSQRVEFPVGMGQQDVYIGRPLLPEYVESVPMRERKALVLDAINALGPEPSEEEPFPGDPELAARADAWNARTGCGAEHAVVLEVLRDLAEPSAGIARLIAAAEGADLDLDDSAEDAWLGEMAVRLLGPGAQGRG
jgi:1-acyl-sn-glycerol-3-phosphate acyltransferase